VIRLRRRRAVENLGVGAFAVLVLGPFVGLGAWSAAIAGVLAVMAVAAMMVLKDSTGGRTGGA